MRNAKFVTNLSRSKDSFNFWQADTFFSKP